MSKIGITELVLRDGHQSLLATRMMLADMLPIADRMDRVGFWSLETWGGATFDSCIRFLNEDPWERLRKLKAAYPKTRMQMLLRGQNLLGYRHYADDVVRKFVERAAANGVEVFRVFDALNDTRNLRTSIEAVKKAGKHAQGTLSYATSPVHTRESYLALAQDLKTMGVDSICIKDMAGLLKPYEAAHLVAALRKEVGIPLSVHSHATTGMSVATLVKAVEAGAELIDTAISSMAMGTSHSPTETLVEIFKGTGYDTDLDVKLLVDIAGYFREVRKKYKQFESAFLGADTRILLAQVPGGMLSNLEHQLREQNAGDKIDAVLAEIELVQKDFGYPPLVTPTSQIVGTQAVFNVLFGRYQRLTAESRDLLTGRYGRTPAAPNEELVQKALKEMGLTAAIKHRPADDIPNEWDKMVDDLKAKMPGATVSEEDVLTYAMFPQVALNFFKSRGQGPKDIAAPAVTPGAVPASSAAPVALPVSDQYRVSVDGKAFIVRQKRDAEGHLNLTVDGRTFAVGVKPLVETESASAVSSSVDPAGEKLDAPMPGTVVKVLFQNGDTVEANATVLIMEALKMQLEIKCRTAGRIRFLVSANTAVHAGVPLAVISGAGKGGA
jgi:oxaloacetate decarboxylase alpha subunit